MARVGDIVQKKYYDDLIYTGDKSGWNGMSVDRSYKVIYRFDNGLLALENYLMLVNERDVYVVSEANTPDEKGEVVFQYSGRIYNRPLGRGIRLYDEKGDFTDLQLEEQIDSGDFEADIVIRKIK